MMDGMFPMQMARQNRSLRWSLTVLLLIELCALYISQWPLLYNFNKFAFWDWGGYLVAHYLLNQGYTPVTGFGWQYGLLPLLLQEIGFHFAEATPASFLFLSLLCALGFTIAVARFANRESGLAGQTLMLLSLPFIVALGSDLPHALEPAFLSLGLLWQAKGNRAGALAFATAACFTKPVMAYLYGFILLVFLIADLHRRGRLTWQNIARSLLPALCTGLCLIVVLGIAFSWRALLTSLLPLSGAHAYRLLHYGWTGIARELFYFPGVRPAYYIGTPVGFLVLATIYLLVALAVASWRIWQGRLRAPDNYEIVLTCTLLHLGFVGLFYGTAASWTYYAYILVMGVAATAIWTPTASRLVWALCVFAALGNYSQLKSSITGWRNMKRSPVTGGLYALPAESSEWAHVTALSDHNSPALFTWDGGASVLFPWLRKPVSAFMVPGIATSNEIRQEVRQLRSAKTLIIPTIPELGNPIASWPGSEFKTILDNTTLVFKGTYFEIYERAQGTEGLQSN
jgi:hypothetical protein